MSPWFERNPFTPWKHSWLNCPHLTLTEPLDLEKWDRLNRSELIITRGERSSYPSHDMTCTCVSLEPDYNTLSLRACEPMSLRAYEPMSLQAYEPTSLHCGLQSQLSFLLFAKKKTLTVYFLSNAIRLRAFNSFSVVGASFWGSQVKYCWTVRPFGFLL